MTSYYPRTKIVCTLGPASSSAESIGALMDAGLNVARINFSHGDREDHAKTAAAVRQEAQSRGLPVPPGATTRPANETDPVER